MHACIPAAVAVVLLLLVLRRRRAITAVVPLSPLPPSLLLHPAAGNAHPAAPHAFGSLFPSFMQAPGVQWYRHAGILEEHH